MYWFYTPTPYGLILWVLALLVSWLGGVLIARHAFRLEVGEPVVLGFGIGLAGWLWLINALAHLLVFDLAIFLSAGLILLAGVLFTLKSGDHFLSKSDLPGWRLAAGGLFAGWLFFKISQGLGIFDEHIHVPLISNLARGSFPVYAILNADQPFTYHYGFHLLGASLMKVGGLFPWSALDLTKGILFGYAVTLIWLLARRYQVRSSYAFYLLGLLLFAGSTRYLLLLAPEGFLDVINSTLGLPAGENLRLLLTSAWHTDGGPPIPFPFAFLSTANIPLSYVHAGLMLFNFYLLVLAWLLFGRTKTRGAIAVLTGLYAFWALTVETGLILFLGGVAFLILYKYFREKRTPKQIAQQFPEAFSAVFTAILMLVQGGVFTSLFQGALTGSSAPGFYLRWPPALISRDFGALSLFSPVELTLAFFEYGFILLLIPWIIQRGWRRYQDGELVMGVVAISSLLGLLIPVFVGYISDHDLTRLTNDSITIILILIGLEIPAASLRIKKTVYWITGLMMVSGVVMALTALTAINQPMLSYGYDKLDAAILVKAWGTLPADSLIFSPSGGKGTTLTGLRTNMSESNRTYNMLPYEPWEAIYQNPSIENLRAEHYDFLYIEYRWWLHLSEEAQQALLDPCTQTIAEIWDNAGVRFRKLVDLRGCVP